MGLKKTSFGRRILEQLLPWMQQLPNSKELEIHEWKRVNMVKELGEQSRGKKNKLGNWVRDRWVEEKNMIRIIGLW